MNRERKHPPGPEKLAILKRYLVEKVPISVSYQMLASA